MGRIRTLVRKDFRIFMRDPVALGLAFAVPLVMIVVFGLVFGGEGGGIGINELSVLGVNQDEGPAGARLFAALDAQDEIHIIDSLRKGENYFPLDSATARKRVATGKNTVALILPEDFSDGLVNGELRAYILEDPRDPVTAGLVLGLMQKQAFSTFPALMPMSLTKNMGLDSLAQFGFNSDLRDAIEKHFDYRIPDSLFNNGAMLFPREFILGKDISSDSGASGFNFDETIASIINVSREQVAGKDVVNPGIAQSVAGPAVMFMLFGVGAIAASLLREMHTGLVQRILMSGASAREVLFSKFVYAVMLGSFQLAAMMVYGRLIFGLQIFDHAAALLIVIVVTATVMSSLGMIISALARTEEQAAGIQVVVILSISAIGGAMFPSFLMPGVMKAIAIFTPVHWAMQGFTNIFWRGAGVAGVMAECGILLLMSTVFLTISLLIFRKRLALELG